MPFLPEWPEYNIDPDDEDERSGAGSAYGVGITHGCNPNAPCFSAVPSRYDETIGYRVIRNATIRDT